MNILSTFRFCALFVLSSLALVRLSAAAEFETSILPRPGDKYASARFRLWLPDRVKTIRGIIVKQHGCGRNGFTHPDDVQWQALARKWDCGLMGSWLQPGFTNCSDWHNPDFGSGHAFLTALQRFASESKHPEVEFAPWALWGHSGGAFWSMEILYRLPERVIAVFPQSGAIAGTRAAALNVPVLFNRGAEDFPGIIQRANGAFQTNRPLGALWGLSVDPKAKHDCRNGRLLAISFFDAVMAQRLPVPTPTLGPAQLLAMNTALAWLGDNATFDIAPAASFKGDRMKASWFPNETVARRWQEFQKTGWVADTTPPKAPTGLKAALVAQSRIDLVWEAEADLESGIKTFNIYRDGERIGNFQGPQKSAAKGNFQAGNYGDEPEPEQLAMKFTDEDVVSGKHTYELTTVNWADLESPRSGPAMVMVK